MASNVKVGAEATVATRVDTAIAAGLGNHLPIGAYGSADYRSAVRFPVPAGWANWSSIVRATLSFQVSDHQHVGPKNSSIFCSRMNISTPVWSKAAGTQSCESGFSGGNATQASDLVSTATDRVTFSSGSTANKAITIDVTAAMRYYWSNGAGTSKPVFVFDNNGADQYTELWSDQKSGSDSDLILSIDYEVGARPTAPTLNSPAVNETVASQQPTFSWTHHDPDGDPQVDALVEVFDPVGPTHYSWHPAVGSAQTLVSPVVLARNVTYQWRVTTYDAIGIGTASALQNFTVQAGLTVVIDPVRYMEFANGAPRLRVKWSVTGGTQARYRVTAGTYDSTWLPLTTQSHLLDTLALTDNVAVPVTVAVEDAGSPVLSGSATRSFTPRYGLTTHRKNLGVAPTGWGSPSWDAGGIPQPGGSTITIEYGSNTSAAAAPTAWYSALNLVPFAQYVYWRAWFIPGAGGSPVMDSINVPTDSSVSYVDKWGTTKDAPGLAGGVFTVSKDEYVYGSRSLWAKVSGAGPFYCYSYGVPVKKGRAYILTGLMKSEGDSGACIELQDAGDPLLPGQPGPVLVGGGVLVPAGTLMRTDPVLHATKAWFSGDPARHDVYRYKTPVYEADADKVVYVALKVGGVAGAQAWFDAVKLEESTVATAWSPGAVGATVVDAGGVQVDAVRGGVFRLRGSGGLTSDEVVLGAHGLEQSGVPLVPPGVIAPYAGAAAPNGWLLCQGQSLLRADFPALFTAIGVVFGSVDGTHFTLPDMRQKFPLGVAAAGTGNALGASGGQVDHTHDYTQVISHDHTATFANALGTGTPSPVSSLAAGAAGGRFGATVGLSGSLPAGVATGVTAAKNPPFLALQFIIKT